VEVSPGLISNVTDAVLDEVRAWQGRALESVYPTVYFDALFVKSREEGAVKKKAVYLALGVNLAGEKELLGLWVTHTEGAKFWLSIFSEAKKRGMHDCFIACVDGLKGLPEADQLLKSVRKNRQPLPESRRRLNSNLIGVARDEPNLVRLKSGGTRRTPTPSCKLTPLWGLFIANLSDSECQQVPETQQLLSQA